MLVHDRLAVLKAMTKVLKEATTEAENQIKCDVANTGITRLTSEFGNSKANISIERLASRPDVYKGAEEDFLDFLEEKGMTERAPKAIWRSMVTRTQNGQIIWTDTGEVVPGCYWEADGQKIVVRFDKAGAENLLKEAFGSGINANEILRLEESK